MARSSIKRITKSYFARFAAWALVHNFVDLLAMVLPVRRTEFERKRVVFVKLDGVGDYIIWTAAFEAIKEKYPSTDYERLLVCNEKVAAFASGSFFDQTLFVDTARFASSPVYRWKMMVQIRRLAADVAINARSSRDFLWGDSIVRCSGAAIRIGRKGIGNLMTPFQDGISAGWYTRLVPGPDAGDHEILSNLALLDLDEKYLSIQPEIQILVPTEPRLRGKRYAVFFLGASEDGKRWPLGKIAEAAERISKDHGLTVVLCGGPEDRHLSGSLDKYFSGQFVDMIGNTLPELSAVIGQAQLLITNDTAAVHIAVAQRCPAVVIAPGNQFGRYLPYPKSLLDAGLPLVTLSENANCGECDATCVRARSEADSLRPCVANVAVSDVVAAAARLLANSREATH